MKRIHPTRFGMGLARRVAVVGMIIVLAAVPMAWAGEADKKILEQRDALLHNVEDMVAHGGMGDAKAILHHCGEAARSADLLIKQLPAAQPGREEGVVSLKDVVRHCQRVSEIGLHADPGVLLGPAIKARTAARTAVKVLGLVK